MVLNARNKSIPYWRESKGFECSQQENHHIEKGMLMIANKDNDNYQNCSVARGAKFASWGIINRQKRVARSLIKGWTWILLFDHSTLLVWSFFFLPIHNNRLRPMWIAKKWELAMSLLCHGLSGRLYNRGVWIHMNSFIFVGRKTCLASFFWQFVLSFVELRITSNSFGPKVDDPG